MSMHLLPEIYETLNEHLAKLFDGSPGVTSPATIAKNAQIDRANINWNATARDIWDGILSYAEKDDKVVEVLKKALIIFPRDETLNSILQKIENGEALSKPVAVDISKTDEIKQDGKLKVIINYNVAEKEYKKTLVDFLELYINNPEPLPITLFDIQEDIPAADDRLTTARQEVESSDMVVLLLSRGFFRGENGFCYDPVTLMAGQLGKRLAPIRVREAPIERIKIIANLQMLPRMGAPLAELAEEAREAALEESAREIFSVLEKMLKAKSKPARPLI